MPRILIAEDDLFLCQQLRASLKAAGYDVDHAGSGTDALQLCRIGSFDLLIIDWNMPGCSGLELCKTLRKEGKKEAILMLTSRSAIDDKELGLDCGVDDYLCKPFEQRELLARVRSLLRRPSAYLSRQVKLGDLLIDFEDHSIKRDDLCLRVQPRELALLEFFLRRPGQLLSTESIFASVWGSDFEGSEIALRSCLAKLRKILAKLGYADLIQTVPKSGYKLHLPD